MNDGRPLRVYIGWDAREVVAWRAALASLCKHTKHALTVTPVGMDAPRMDALYWRPTERRDGQLWDVISAAPMSTGFAIARFLVPYLAGFKGWAVFCDCDFLFRTDIAELFALADDRFAVQVVKHHYVTGTGKPKMDAQAQTIYPRKNWSSLILWNCGHECNRVLTPEVINTQTGRWLHGFRWLADDLIGALPFEWNWLELSPKAVHFTLGTPNLEGHSGAAYADEWWRYVGGDDHASDIEGAVQVDAGGRARDEATRRQGPVEKGGARVRRGHAEPEGAA